MSHTQPYGIGLDIGTNSVGFVATDEAGHLIRAKGKNVIGAYLFNAGKSAAERRGFRTTRRRLARVKWRLRLLREFFESHITPQDHDFFLRQKYASVSPRDDRFRLTKGLFNDRTDQEFYQEYPTIYHLRHALMTEDRQFDVREIYLAIHHIVKYRGHFLSDAPANSFKTGRLDLVTSFEAINDAANQISPEWQLNLPTNIKLLDAVKTILLGQDSSQNDRQKEVVKLLTTDKSTDKDVATMQKKVIMELIKAIVGQKTKLWLLAGLEKDSDWEIQFENYNDFVEMTGNELSEPVATLFDWLNQLYGVVTLAGIVPEGKTFSEGMIESYQHHAKNLKQLKAYCAEQKNKQRGHEIREAYDRYIDGNDGKAVTQGEFMSELKKFVDSDRQHSELAQQIFIEISQETFMPKLRTKANGAIPHQVQQQELDAIIDRQKKYYAWLGEENPVQSHRKALPYKLDELVSFRVPYYVGPLAEKKTDEDTPETRFAWMQRKAAGEITPWNFDEKVDREKSATAFIQRMKTTDTMLIGEDVLPQQSLQYQKFEVLNELNKIQIDGHPITVPLKQRLFNELFKSKKSITVKQVVANLTAHDATMVGATIAGLSDPLRFNSSYSTYIDYKKILGDQIDDVEKQADIEQIIAWSTIFEDPTIFRSKLNEITWLSEEQRKALSHLRYHGWGRYSEKMLSGLRDGNGQTILERMWQTNNNFMQVQADPVIAEQIEQANGSAMESESINDIIDGFYTSPENKKALREVMKVVKDIQRAMHGQAPAWIYIESPREQNARKGRTLPRSTKVRNLYDNAAKNIIDQRVDEELTKAVKSGRDFNDRLLLYFLQNGRDLYTGESLSIDQLSVYDIDHILPQSLIKDDSLDNRVLVHAKINRTKNDLFASDLYMGRMRPMWLELHKEGLISSRKLRHLQMRPDEISKFAPGFIARQLTETRQVIRLTANLLDNLYQKDETQIVMIRARLNTDFRSVFEFPKLRNVNDYHHAFDAFLTAKIGQYLLKRYPKLTGFFVYGDFVKSDKIAKQMTKFNFIGQLKNDVVDPATDEIIWDKSAEIAELKHVFDYKKMLVTRATTEKHGELYKQTILAAKKDSSNKLIPIKQDRPTDIYGGYTQKASAYLSIIWLNKENKYRVMGVDTAEVDQLTRLASAEGEAAVRAALHEIFFKALNAETKRGIDHAGFRVVVPKIPFEQVVQDEGMRFGLGSAGYYRNIQQLFLPRDLQQVLIQEWAGADHIIEVFDAILDQVERYFDIFDIHGFREKLIASRDQFLKLPIGKLSEKDSQRDVLNLILNGLHADAGRSNLKILGIKTDFGLLSAQKIYLSAQAKLVYSSPTGLFTRIVPLSSL